MAENSKIEWTDHTFNPWVGCTKVSPACDHCYAESWAKRTGNQELWTGERRRTTPANWRKPIKWNREAGEQGIRYRVFCASLADVFDNAVPMEWRIDLFRLIYDTPNLDWLLLTKRIGNAAAMLPPDWMLPNFDVPGDWSGGYPNVWIGATVVNQEEADRDIPKLLKTPAAVRFLSMEPLLGPVDLRRHIVSQRYGMHPDGINLHPFWVIVGGESGPHARPMDIEWCESIANQCRDANVPFFMKQGSQANWTEFKNFDEFHESVRIRQFPQSSHSNGK